MFMRLESSIVDCQRNRLLGGFSLLLRDFPTTMLDARSSREHVGFSCLYEARCHLIHVRPWCLIHQDYWSLTSMMEWHNRFCSEEPPPLVTGIETEHYGLGPEFMALHPPRAAAPEEGAGKEPIGSETRQDHRRS